MNRTYRLRKNRDYQRVYRRGKSVGSHLMALVYVRAPGGLKIGFSASKKIGNAVTRNRARRRMRECVRVRIPRIKSGWHMVFIARRSIADAPFSGIEKCVDKLLTQANLWRSAETSGAPREREARPVAAGKEAAEP